jgi:hypothetical protein
VKLSFLLNFNCLKIQSKMQRMTALCQGYKN